MKLLDTNTPLKIKHIIIAVFAVAVIFFGYSMYKQVTMNTANVQAIVQFLNQAQEQNDSTTETPR